jgi:hypothetical protein
MHINLPDMAQGQARARPAIRLERLADRETASAHDLMSGDNGCARNVSNVP